MARHKFLVGIDEVGRGALAGPIVIGAAAGFWNRENKKLLKGIRDSKKLTPKQREEWFRKLKMGNLALATVSISNKLIDKKGISWTLKIGAARIFKKIKKKPDLVLLDGGLKAPKQYKQKTIIKGDDKIPLISAASIYAKVRRDRLMVKLDGKYPYGFKDHKGYGTKKHYQNIRKNGLSRLHRRSFLKFYPVK